MTTHIVPRHTARATTRAPHAAALLARSARDRAAPGKLRMRLFEIAAQRKDGSIFIGQHQAPAMHLFESAFAALARGTLIATPEGEVAIEDLQPGDEVHTARGEVRPIRWIGSSSFVPADAGRRVPLIRVMAETFGQGRPSSFVTLGPAARILQTPQEMRGDDDRGQILAPIRSFADSVSVIEVVPPTPVRLFHLCLDRHAAVIAGGLEIETFHPGESETRTLSSSLRDTFLFMFPHLNSLDEFGPLAYPRAEDTPPVRN